MVQHSSFSIDKWPMDKELGIKLLLFLLWPFGAFLYSLRNAASKSSYVIYFLFGIIFCWHMDSTGSSRYDDLEGIMSRFESHRYTTAQVWTEISNYFAFDGSGPKEIYEIILTWFTRLFADNPHLFFALASIPFLLCYLPCLRKITSDTKFSSNFYCLVILLLFVLPRDIITVQNPRYCTAMWLAVLGTLDYFLSSRHKLRSILFVAAAPLIHSAFWFYIIVFVAGNIFLHYKKLCFIVFCISIPFAFIDRSIIGFLDYTQLPIPTNFLNWASDHYAKKMQAGPAAGGYYWIGAGFNIIKNASYVILTLVMWKNRRKFDMYGSGLCMLFYFFIFYYSYANFANIIPVLGERSFFVVRILAIFLWFKLMYPQGNRYLLLLLLCCSWDIFSRYFYHGAVESSVPLGILWEPLPLLIFDYI